MRFKSTYTNGDMKTESVTYIKGERERFEFQDMILLKQRDQKRTVQISKTANTYLVAPDGMPSAPAGAGCRAGRAAQAAGRDHGRDDDRRYRRAEVGIRPAGPSREDDDRQAADGRRVRHVQAAHRDRRLVHRRPASGYQSGRRDDESGPRLPAGCADQIQATSNGDPKVLGFPIAYTTTVTGDDGKPVIASMEVTEFEATTLDAALFEIPPGLNAAMNVRELSKAVSDANEERSWWPPIPRLPPRRPRRRPAWCESACPSSPTRRRRPWIHGRCASA